MSELTGGGLWRTGGMATSPYAGLRVCGCCLRIHGRQLSRLFVTCFSITLPVLVDSLVDAGRSGHGVVAACGGGVLAATGGSEDGRIPRRERKPPGNSRELHSWKSHRCRLRSVKKSRRGHSASRRSRRGIERSPSGWCGVFATTSYGWFSYRFVLLCACIRVHSNKVCSLSSPHCCICLFLLLFCFHPSGLRHTRVQGNREPRALAANNERCYSQPQPNGKTLSSTTNRPKNRNTRAIDTSHSSLSQACTRALHPPPSKPNTISFYVTRNRCPGTTRKHTAGGGAGGSPARPSGSARRRVGEP